VVKTTPLKLPTMKYYDYNNLKKVSIPLTYRVKNNKYRLWNCFCFPYRKNWMISEDIEFKLSNGEKVLVPRGFETDLASVPRILWSITPPYGDFLLAIILHDWLYASDYKRSCLGERKARKFSDDEMLKWSNKMNLNKFDNYLKYFGVRLFGGMVYKRINNKYSTYVSSCK